MYDALLRDREEVDYVAFVELDPDVLTKELVQTEKFVNIFEKMLTE